MAFLLEATFAGLFFIGLDKLSTVAHPTVLSGKVSENDVTGSSDTAN